jgi:hypothetical protein
MPNTELTLENIRTVIHEEITAERKNTRKLIHDEILAEREHTRKIIHNEIITERQHTREFVHDEIAGVAGRIDQLRVMLEEDARAESRRLSRADRRSLKTQKQLSQHLTHHTKASPAGY